MIFWKRVHFESNVKLFGEETLKRLLLFLFIYYFMEEGCLIWKCKRPTFRKIIRKNILLHLFKNEKFKV